VAQVDLIVMGNQPSTTFIDLDEPAREIHASGVKAPLEAPKKRRGRPPGSKNRTQPVEAVEKETNDG
jgi:hypothetical protein